MLAKMAHAGTSGAPTACSTTTTGNWYDAPWMGLGLGELARADVPSRTVQLGLVHPENIPASIAPILPDLPSSVPNAAAAAVLALRLPQ